MTKEEFRIATAVLKEFCNNKSFKGWEKSYFALFLEMLEDELFSAGKHSTELQKKERVNHWMELMAFCEYMCQISYFDAGKEIDPAFEELRESIRDGLWRHNDD